MRLRFLLQGPRRGREDYEFSVEGFPPMQYSREDIRRGLSFYETEQGTLAQQ
ncbi:hypothetical protein STANM309S_06783 [Streptomyces tanashiensis]